MRRGSATPQIARLDRCSTVVCHDIHPRLVVNIRPRELRNILRRARSLLMGTIKFMVSRLRADEFAWLITSCLWISIAAFAQDTPAQTGQDGSDLRTELLSSQTSDSQWSAAERSFETLPPNVALLMLFPEIAKGIPGGYSYAAYNCFDPLQDRKVAGWGQFCVVNSLWCKQLACSQTRKEVSTVLLALWANPITEYGQMVLLEGLCDNPDAELPIAVLFRDNAAKVRLRTQAAVCLLRQAEPKYHAEVVAFAEKVPITFTPPGPHPYRLQLRRVLFDELASPTHRKAGIDAAVVHLGFDLLLDAAEQQERARQQGSKVSDYGQYLYADRLSAYLGTAFEPYRKQPAYSGSAGNERFWHDTVVNALSWWSAHKEEYGVATEGPGLTTDTQSCGSDLPLFSAQCHRD